MSRTATVFGVAAVLATAGGVFAHGAHHAAVDTDGDGIPDIERVHFDFPVDESGLLSGGVVEFPMPEVTRQRLRDEAVGRPGRSAIDNRVDLVFVGDGYTANDMSAYHAHTAAIRNELFGYEPFTSYEPYFRVHEIEVISNESGVSNDPAVGIIRDTALGMSYWCNGIERLLCVNVNSAYFYANAAPDVDQVIAVANSSKYGGAGYPSSDLGTVAGANSFAADITIHELGHSLGNLADEYDYGGPVDWPGGEPGTANVSTYQASEMLSLGVKWASWIGASDTRFDGPVSTYEGANYSVNGIYRPTPNSMMRALGRRFNGPSAEQLIAEIYREVSPVDAFSPPTETPVQAEAVLSVTPMQPRFHTLDVSWELDGVPIAGATGTTLDLADVGVAPGAVVTAVVVDNTTMVRDETLRAQRLTQRVTWDIEPLPPCPSDTNGDRVVGPDDLFIVLANFGQTTDQGPAAGDLDSSGIVSPVDLFKLLSDYGTDCDA